ncbi:hypothetical protein [Rhodopseudomonas sp. BR0M22]|uniref:hypothetical protein n=1 Tax=Rhodopseudomonas sp. BR0M22 TaxID=2269369 RepID=UPI0013E0458C|nr:hypothetical protein [Rhodopseudomonas sp. BR0M22]
MTWKDNAKQKRPGLLPAFRFCRDLILKSPARPGVSKDDAANTLRVASWFETALRASSP